MKRLGELCIAALTALALVHAGAVSVEVDPSCLGMGTVTWSERNLGDGNSRLTLKATAMDGNSFSGWSAPEEKVVAWADDWRYPGSLTATVESNAVVAASFIEWPEDRLKFDISEILAPELSCGQGVSQELSVDSVSFPTVTFKNLPPGLSYDARTLTLFGAPTEPGLYEIEADAVNDSGFSFNSIQTVRVLNIEGGRISGIDQEIAQDEYWYAEPSELFIFDEVPVSISLAADVPGLLWNDDWQLLYGTPTEAGEYTIRVSADFATGKTETATMSLSVLGPDPSDYGFDLDGIAGLRVGDSLDETCEIGAESDCVRVANVSGLPAGIKAAFWRDDHSVRHWYVSGIVKEPGFFTVAIQLEDSSDETQRVVTAQQRIAVADSAKVYFNAKSSDTGKGSVSGGGVVSPADDVTLVANPRSGYVFSGWYDAEGNPLVLLEGVDYRTASIALPAGTDFSSLSPVARFVAKSEDVAPDLYDLEESEFSLALDEAFEETFTIDSFSLPTLTFKNLPRGVKCTAAGDGTFVLTYDRSAGEAVSGRYTVTVTATNASGRKSSASFRITVGNRTDPRIHVEDDYGEFTPGEEIGAIDLSGVVEFGRGESLSVLGLPRGLVYNSKSNARKGIAANTITGTPVVPGEYTLTFSAKVVAKVSTNATGKVVYSYETAKATSFVTVLSYPAISIEVDGDAAESGCKVKGAGNYKPGTKVTLKATAAKGWVFAGWLGLDDIDGLALMNPSLTYVSGESDTWLQADFVTADMDGLSLNAPTPDEHGYAAEWLLKEKVPDDDSSLIADLIETGSWPTVKVSGLPGGVKFSSSTFLLSGAPTKSGVYHVTVTAKNAGGYSFVRVIDIAVLNSDGSLPAEKALENPSGIDFSPLTNLTTGVHCPTGAVVLTVGTKPETGVAVKRASVSGLPAGLSARTSVADGGASIEITGTPTKPGRFIISVSATYADGKTLKSQSAIVVEDGGSEYLYVSSDDPESGTVTGEGVYASGATVKLAAKPKSKQVFSGWFATDSLEDPALFESLRVLDGIDPRTASVSFPFRPLEFHGGYELVGAFVASSNDYASVIDVESDVWELDPSESSSFHFAVDSSSLPKVSVSGIPKGVTIDAARGIMTYVPTASTIPGVYTATISAKNVSQKPASTRMFEIRVANRVSEVINGLDPDLEAYSISVGTTLDQTLIMPTADDGWSLSVKGLPSGLSFKNGAVIGIPSKVGNYTVTFTATTGSGKGKLTESATIVVHVTALPTSLCGNYIGVLCDNEITTGTVSITTSSAGKISLTAKTAAKSYKFTAKSWDALTNGLASVEMLNKDGAILRLCIENSSEWRSWQASGVLQDGAVCMSFEAQRDSYGTKDGLPEARETIAQMVGKSTVDGLTVNITAKGAVTFAGKYEGASLSGSTILQAEESEYFARYVKFIDKKSILIVVFYFDETGKVTSYSVEKR